MNDQAMTMAAFALEMSPAEFREKETQFFSYNLAFTPLTAAATASKSFQVQKDSWFVWLVATATARTTAAGAPSVADRPMTVTLEEQGSGTNLQNIAWDFDSLFGTAQREMVLPVPRFLRPSTTFDVSLTSLASVDLTVRISFVGYKVYNRRWDVG